MDKQAFRRARRTAAVLAGALVVAACGSAQSGTAAAPGASAATRTLTDAAGRTVNVPAAPHAVVALSEPTLDAALALGIQPVGTTAGRGQNGVATYLAAKAEKAQVVATVAEPDLEKLATLRPDLILLDETVGAKRVLDKLQAIAPTVLTAKLNADWRTAFTVTADALGKSSQAQTWLTDFDASVASAKTKLGANAGATVSVIRWQNGAPSVVGKGVGHVGSTLSALGLGRPADQQGASSGHSEPVSLEKLDTIDGDWMFFGTLGDKTVGQQAYEEAAKVPNFTELGAAKKGHVVVVEGSAWNSAGGPLAAQTVLDDITRALAG
ncbi:amonabactin ABC transporter substrate-binding protein [Nonomuraea rosea]|uniref:Amonabactin ABC transporter substrate-binding protein n=1 Tax=Nonomuraea rosea TaxID=638574 RepID=A0ABP6XIU1_9ACTN